MKKAVKRDWVNSLRSGQYRQTQGTLCRKGRFCCLGVLCDILKKRVGGRWGDQYFITRKESHGGDLPESVAEAAGLKDQNPWLHGKRLSEWNDGGDTFPQIADLIEKHL